MGQRVSAGEPLAYHYLPGLSPAWEMPSMHKKEGFTGPGAGPDAPLAGPVGRLGRPRDRPDHYRLRPPAMLISVLKQTGSR
jgi:hypothetical protein